MWWLAFYLLVAACERPRATGPTTIPGYVLGRDHVEIGFEAHVEVAGRRVDLRIALPRRPTFDGDEKLVRVRADGSWSEIALPPPPDDQPARSFRVRVDRGQLYLYSIVPTSDYVDLERVVHHIEYRWPLVWDRGRDNVVVGPGPAILQ